MNKKYLLSGMGVVLFLMALFLIVAQNDSPNKIVTDSTTNAPSSNTKQINAPRALEKNTQENTTVYTYTPSNTPNTMLDTIDTTLFSKKNSAENRTIIDVRTPQEYASGHLEKAVNIDFYDSAFTEKLNALDKTQAISIYCRSGNRSGQALQTMESLGFTNVIDLEGGVQSWVDAGNTLCTDC